MKVGDLVDFRAVGYLMSSKSSMTTLNNLVLTLKGDATLTADSFGERPSMFSYIISH